MSLLQLMTGCWAMEPAALREMQSVYATHLRGEKIDVPAIEARLGRPLASEQSDYRIEAGGVAVLEASGIMAPKANLMMQVSGGISTQILARNIDEAAANPAAKSILLALDSPGGNVLGVPEAADAVYRATQQKPVVVLSSEQLTSAGYYVASAASAVYVSGPLVQVGSIGVLVARSFDPTQTGVQEHITAGKYKVLGNSREPLSADSRAIVQADVDYVYSIFVDDVARYRGTSSALVLEHMADGRVFRGAQAINAGLVDGVSSMSALVELMATNPAQFAKRRSARFGAKKAGGVPLSTGAGAAHVGVNVNATLPTPERISMEAANLNRETLQAENPNLFASLQSEMRAEGAQTERDRIAAVRATVVPGHEALVEAMAMDGRSSAADAALAVNAAVRASITAAAAAHREDAPAAIAASAAPTDKAASRGQQVVDARAYAAEHKCDFVSAMKALGHTK